MTFYQPHNTFTNSTDYPIFATEDFAWEYINAHSQEDSCENSRNFTVDFVKVNCNTTFYNRVYKYGARGL